MAPIHLFSPAADQFPAAPDLYNILKIDPAATDAEVEAKHTRYADYLQSEGFQLMRLEYSREEFEAKVLPTFFFFTHDVRLHIRRSHRRV